MTDPLQDFVARAQAAQHAVDVLLAGRAMGLPLVYRSEQTMRGDRWIVDTTGDYLVTDPNQPRGHIRDDVRRCADALERYCGTQEGLMLLHGLMHSEVCGKYFVLVFTSSSPKQALRHAADANWNVAQEGV